jgi:hypothetical protein
MLTTVPHPFSQIEIMHQLREVGFTQEQAEAQARIITEVNENSLATKQDVQNLEKKTDSEISLLRKDMNNEFALARQEMRGEFALVRKEMEAMKLDLTVRLAAIMASLLTLFGAAQKFLM